MKEKKEKLTLENCPDILTAIQVAEILSVSERTVGNLISNYELDSFKIGKLRRITKMGLYKFVYEQSQDEYYNPNNLIRNQQKTYVPHQENKSEVIYD